MSDRHPCRCGHAAYDHRYGIEGPCEVCRCPEYRADYTAPPEERRESA